MHCRAKVKKYITCLKVHCHAIGGDFLRHFVVGKINGGHASFQTKRAQQVSCLSIIVVYICFSLCTLCCVAKYTQMRLKDRESWTIVGPRHLKIDPWSAARLFWIPRTFHHCSWANLSFCFHFVDHISNPTSSERGMTLQGQVANWLMLRRWSIAKLRTDEGKKCGQSLPLVGLESPRRHFWPQNIYIKTLNSVTVHRCWYVSANMYICWQAVKRGWR